MTTTRRLLCWVALGAALLGFAGGAFATTSQQERELGAGFDLMAQAGLPLNNDPEVLHYVEAIGQKIVAGLKSSTFEYKFSVVRDPSINAFAVPGGYVYVHEGLITNAANDDEVASVMGHEVAHVNAHHMVRQQEKTQLLNYAAMLAMLAAFVRPELAALAQAGEQAARLKYSREFEQEADYLGVRYMQSAGYDSRSMLDFLKKLEDKGRMFPDVPPFLQSHPLSQERLNNLEAVLRTQQWSSHDRPLASFTLARVQALIQARYGPPQDVLEVYQMALRERPGDPMRNYLVGVVALETGHLVDAEAALRKARQGGIVAADRELGRLALRNREVDEAIRLLREHLQRRPNDASARGELAKALEISGDPDAARAEYKMAWESAPRFAAAHRGYGLLEGRSGDEAEGFFHLATAARLQGEYEQALEQYKRAQPLLPADDPRSADAAKWIRDLTAFLD